MVATRPSDRQSAYLPLEYTFTEQEYPNTIAGESQSILNIAKPTTAELANYTQLEEDDIRIQHGTISGLSVGQHVRLLSVFEELYFDNKETFGYAKNYKVKKIINQNITVIEAEYLGDVAPAGST